MHQKLKNLISVGNVCTFTTLDRHGKVNSRRTPTAGIDADANLWFFTDDFNRSRTVPEGVNFAHLVYANGRKQSYIRIYGNSVLVNNREKLQEFWSPEMKEWFPLGPDDPKLTLIKVKTREVDFSSGSSGRISQAFNLLKSFFVRDNGNGDEKKNLISRR